MDKEKLLCICKNHLLPQEIDVVIREPYIPYVPSEWNKILVLGESQALSAAHAPYVRELKEMSKLERISRLKNPADIGVKPWDEGSLKIALKAAGVLDPEHTAVSNAVMWSQVSEKNKNITPTKALQNHSATLWDDFLKEMNPVKIFASGTVANSVLQKTSWAGEVVKIIHPSHMRWIKSEQDEDDLLSSYPAVKNVVDTHPDWLRGSRKRIIRFSCHVYDHLNQI